MVKKIFISSLFLIGGIFFIKKILPSLVKNNKKSDLELLSAEDEINKIKEQNKELGRKVQEQLDKKFGKNADLNDIKTFMFAPNINFDNLTPEQIENLKNSFKNNKFFKNGLSYDPNNLDSFKGLRGYKFSMS